MIRRMEISRREFLRLGLAGGVALTVPFGAAACSGEGSTGRLLPSRAKLPRPFQIPLPVPPVYELIARLGAVSAAEMWEVFNMGCGFCVIVAAERAYDAAALLEGRHPGATVIGTVTDRTGCVDVPSLGITGDRDGLRAV